MQNYMLVPQLFFSFNSINKAIIYANFHQVLDDIQWALGINFSNQKGSGVQNLRLNLIIVDKIIDKIQNSLCKTLARIIKICYLESNDKF